MRVLIYLFVLFCFFPYIDLFRLGTDTQPNALIFGTIIIFAIKDKKVNLPLLLLWIAFFISTFLVFYNNLSFFNYLKNTLNYLSPALVATATYLILSQLKFRVSYKLFLGVITTYTVVGLVQLYLMPSFLGFLVNGAGRGTLVGGRGVVSLFSEPAFYGTTCLFFLSYALLIFDKRQNRLIVPILLFQVFFLSRSATAIAILLFGFGLFTTVQLLRFRLRYVLATTFLLLAFTPIALHFAHKMQSTRAGDLAQTFIENPLLITQVDGSVGIRFTGTIAPFLVMRHHYMKPQGLGYYIEFLRDFREKRMYTSFLTINNSENKPRLSGALNMVLYQLGFLGLFFPIAIYLSFKGQLGKDRVLFAFILFLVALMTQIQMMNAMIGFVIGTAIYRGKLNTMEGKEDKIYVDSLGTN